MADIRIVDLSHHVQNRLALRAQAEQKPVESFPPRKVFTTAAYMLSGIEDFKTSPAVTVRLMQQDRVAIEQQADNFITAFDLASKLATGDQEIVCTRPADGATITVAASDAAPTPH